MTGERNNRRQYDQLTNLTNGDAETTELGQIWGASNGPSFGAAAVAAGGAVTGAGDLTAKQKTTHTTTTTTGKA
jgi:hypothetical protein